MNTSIKCIKRQNKILIVIFIALVNLAATIESYGQYYRYDVIATSNSNLPSVNAPSINNNGEVAFSGRKSSAAGVFIDYLLNQPIDLLYTAPPQWIFSGQVQINDSRQILAQYSIFTTNPVQNYLTIIDGTKDNTRTIAGAANGAGSFNDFNEIYPTGLAFNNNNRPVFQTRTGNNTTILTAGTRTSFFYFQTFTPSAGPIFRPVISDNNTTVIKKGTTAAATITTYAENLNNTTEIKIAQASDGFTQLGQSPSISRKDEAVSFYGNLNATGATALGTNSGAGIFVSLKLANGQRKIIRLVGRLVEDDPAPGGNNNQICDPGETCVQGELGFNQAGDRIFFNSFDIDSRVDVGYIGSGAPGIDDATFFVSFIATPNIASDSPNQTFSNQKGLWTLAAHLTTGDDGNLKIELEKPIKVAQVGDVINGNTLTDIIVYDQMANSKDKIAFLGTSANGNMIIRAVIDRKPIIFVPGIGGSELKKADGPERLWAPTTLSADLTPLNINNPVRATDVLRDFDTGVYGVTSARTSIYTELINSFKSNGYVEYNLDGDENRLNADCGGQQNIDAQKVKHPTLFVFPYDWRKSNRANGNDGGPDKLKKYIQCVRQIYPDTDINIVAHSMGGVLSRRYILENPTDHHVKNLITLATPWLGAPRAIHALETGSFLGNAFDDGRLATLISGFSNLVTGSQIKQLIEGFPGAHELLPTPDYYSLGGNPLRIDDVNYDFTQTRDWLNSRHPTAPGTNGQSFHSFIATSNNKQDDFRNDTTGVNYYHIYARQKINKTVGRVESRLKAIVSDTAVTVYTEYVPIASPGDGTVPITSSSRRIDSTDGLNATCGTATDSRCIGICYPTDSHGVFDPLTNHNGMTGNPQVQAEVMQILRFADGLISENKFPANDCHLPSNNFASRSASSNLAPQSTVEAHYLTMSGIKSAQITDLQGNTNQAISAAYKLTVPKTLETIIGNSSMQVIAPVDNAYTIRFTGTGQPLAVEDIRGATNELTDASYIVRYDDINLPNGRIAEIKIVNDLVDSLKVDNDGDGVAETVIPPSRTISNPQTEDLQPPHVEINWHATTVSVGLTDSGSGIKKAFYRFCGQGTCSASFTTLNQSSFDLTIPVSTSAIEIVAEDNAGNRSNVSSFEQPANLQLVSQNIIDNGGDGDNILEPGESAQLNVTLFNSGNRTSRLISATLASLSSYATVTGATSLYNDISKNTEGTGISPFNITLAANAPRYSNIKFRLTVTDDSATIKTFDFAITAGEQNKILFVSNRTGNNEIYTANTDGGVKSNLSNNSSNDASPNWSPNASKIVFVRDIGGSGKIFTMNADGGNQTQLTATGNCIEPRWSPDGSKIVYLCSETGGNQIFTITADGMSAVQITNSSNTTRTSVKWSPNGDKLVYVNKSTGSNPSNAGVFTVNADGSGQLQISSDVGAEDAQWSPDGNSISRIINKGYNQATGRIVYELVVSGADGTGVKNLTTGTAVKAFDWSPDSSKIVFVDDLQNNASNEISIVEVSSGTTTLIVDSTSVLFSDGIKWSPFDNKLAVAGKGRALNACGGVFTVNSDGSGLLCLTPEPGNHFNPVFRPADPIPPVSSISITPSANAAGWNNSDTTVGINSVDNQYGSGTKNISYSLSGAQTTAPNSVNGSAANFSLFTEGITVVSYAAQDNFNNSEMVKTLTVKIDKSLPKSQHSAALSGQQTIFTLTAADAGSGIGEITYSIDGGQSQSYGTPFSVSNTGGHYVTYYAKDVAGNEESPHTVYINAAQVAKSVSISEFRTRGQLGADDEFVELYNNGENSVDIGGWLLSVKQGSVATPITLATINNGAIIPARGHYLLRKSGTGNYSLSGYAEADQTYPGSLGDNIGIALISTSSVIIDAVGFSSVTDSAYREGAGLAPSTGITVNGQYSFVRNYLKGGLIDSNNNRADFIFVSTDGGTYNNLKALTGSPGPENLSSPVYREGDFSVAQIDDKVTLAEVPNRLYDYSETSQQYSVGTLSVRRRITNNTGGAISTLRFRITAVTTKNSAAIFPQQAVLKLTNSSDITVTSLDGARTYPLKGLTIENVPTTVDGGFNSTLTLSLGAGGLSNGDGLNVNLKSGIVSNGQYKLEMRVEAKP